MIKALINSNYNTKQWIKEYIVRLFGFMGEVKKEGYLTQKEIINKFDFPINRQKIKELEKELNNMTKPKWLELRETAKRQKEKDLIKFNEEKAELLATKKQLLGYIEKIKYKTTSKQTDYKSKTERQQKEEYLNIFFMAARQVDIALIDYEYFIYDVPKCSEYLTYESYLESLKRIIRSHAKIMTQDKNRIKNLAYYKEFCEYVDGL